MSTPKYTKAERTILIDLLNHIQESFESEHAKLHEEYFLFSESNHWETYKLKKRLLSSFSDTIASVIRTEKERIQSLTDLSQENVIDLSPK